MTKGFKLIVLALLATATSIFAQSSKATWAEMKNFHHFMSTTFHPSEEGNLAPLREKADSMLIAAKQWQVSAIPANYKTSETKKTLKKLVKQCVLIKKSVTKNATDEVLKKQISDAHDIFHSIVKECRKEDEEKH